MPLLDLSYHLVVTEV